MSLESSRSASSLAGPRGTGSRMNEARIRTSGHPLRRAGAAQPLAELDVEPLGAHPLVDVEQPVHAAEERRGDDAAGHRPESGEEDGEEELAAAGRLRR